MMKVNESNLGYTYKKWRYVFKLNGYGEDAFRNH